MGLNIWHTFSLLQCEHFKITAITPGTLITSQDSIHSLYQDHAPISVFTVHKQQKKINPPNTMFDALYGKWHYNMHDFDNGNFTHLS